MANQGTEPGTASTTESELKPTGMKRANQVAAIILFSVAGYIIAQALGMRLKDEYGPGPGLFPFGLGVILAVLSASLFIEHSSSRKQDKASPFPDRKGSIAVGLVILALLAYILLINTLGFVLTTLLFVLFLMGVVQHDKPRTTIITAVAVAVMLYLIFEVGLGARLPRGPLGF
jgi:putative tricarboxylic transport membrane protein